MRVDGLSVVIPVYNERDNIKPLSHELIAALDGVIPFEMIFVDDASNDQTANELQHLSLVFPRFRYLQHTVNRGQSAAVISGVRAARYPWVATLDGDRQNDPQDLPRLIDAVNQQAASRVLCMGQRVERRDTWLRKISSWIANGVRKNFLRDNCVDSGCGIKLFPRDLFLQLPLFKNCHRFLPALFHRSGARVIYVPVSHRERVAGVSKYGVVNRLWVGIIDLFGVAWLMRRTIEDEGD